MEVEEFKNQLETKDNLIKTLQDSLKIKEDQISTIQDSLQLKDDQILTLKNSLKIKEEQLKVKSSNLIDKSLVIEKDKEIKELKNEIEILNDELKKAKEDIGSLNSEIENIKKTSSDIKSESSSIIDFSDTVISKTEILDKMKEILEKALHKVTIAVPTIEHLQDLRLYEVRSSVNIQISAMINPGVELHTDLLEEFDSLDNISLRSYEGRDRFVILRDGEELLFAVVGIKDDNHLVFYTRDESHIRLYNSLIMESWLRSRKL